MSDISPINKSYPVTEGKSNTISGQLIRWFNELQNSVMSSLRKDNNGIYLVSSITSASASALIPKEGYIVFVSDTDATFTSVGFWGYQIGTWSKL